MYNSEYVLSLSAQLHHIENETTDADSRTKARTFIVSLSTGGIVDFQQIERFVLKENQEITVQKANMILQSNSQ